MSQMTALLLPSMLLTTHDTFPMTSFATFRDRYVVSKSAVDSMSDKLDDFGSDTACFFKNVLISGVFRPGDKRWVRISRQARERKLPGANPKALRNASLLQSGSGSRWRIPDEAYYEFIESLTVSGSDVSYDLFEDRKSEWIYRSNKYDDSRNPYPPLLQDAIEALSTGYFNKSGIQGHLASSRRRAVDLDRKIGSAECYTEDKLEALQEQLQFHRARRAQDLMCSYTVGHQSPKHHHGDLHTYELGYQPTLSGHLRQIGGGLQQCSVPMKEAAYSGLDNACVYKIRASIPTMLRDLMVETGWDPSFLDQYVKRSNSASEHANRVGVTKAQWESLLDSVCLGAKVPCPHQGGLSNKRPNGGAKQPGGTFCTRFRRILRSEYGTLSKFGTGDCYKEYLRVHRRVSELCDQLWEWREYMFDEWIPEEKAYGGRGGRWIENDMGCSCGFSKIFEMKHNTIPRWMLRFLVRGREAHLVHTLTVEADAEGLKVISNEQDGIVTRGQIPDDTLQLVQKESPLDHVEIQEQKIN